MPFVLRRSSPVVAKPTPLLALALTAVACFPLPSVQAQSLDTPSSQTLIWNVKQQGDYVMALLRDSQGRNWAATEGKGLWMSDVKAPNGWRGFGKASSGIADNSFYTLAEDRQGRIWAGTLNQGVSIFDGKVWKNYGALDIPISERVFDIVISPLDGDVWIASSQGLTRYRVKTDRWQQYTREQGLPSDQVQALAFDAKGTLYTATQCDGLVIGSATDEYSTWRQVKGLSRMGTTPSGRGLPTNILNDVLVTKSGAVFVATMHGLAKSTDDGLTWSYVRGRDYESKVRESWIGAPKTADGKPWQASKSLSVPLLAEDNVTSLAEDAQGNIWLGHRWQVPYEVIDQSSGEVLYSGSRDSWRGNTWQKANNFSQTDVGINDYITAMLPLPSGQALIARYGGGVTWTSWQVAKQSATGGAALSTRSALSSYPKTAAMPKLPSFAVPPTLKELQAALSELKKSKPQTGTSAKQAVRQAAVYLGEDWTTQGDWVGRYGTRYAMLCAMQAPMNHEVVSDARYRVMSGDIGPHRLAAQNINDLKGHALPSDSLRHWISWHREYSNRNVLYNPILGFRRQAEWDDHSEATSSHSDMGSVWTKIIVPAGIHKVTGFWWNKDGEGGANRFRDYLLEIKADAPDVAAAEQMKPLASARVRDFKGGGVYKSFLVQGPGKYWFKVGRNYSFNTITPGFFLDKVAGASSTYDDMGSPYLLKRFIEAPAVDEKALETAIRRSDAKAQTLKAAVELWNALEKSSPDLSRISTQRRFRLLSYRASLASGAPADLLANWRFSLQLWTDADRREFDSRMQQAHATLLVANPELKLLQQ